MNKSTQWYCKECLEKYKYNERFDAYYCKKCDEWKEGRCDDEQCFYCVTRPDKPSEINIKQDDCQSNR